MKLITSLLFTLFAFNVLAQTLPTEQHVNVERYIGKWYAISSLPQFFTRNCEGQTAEYEIINPQTISVKNTCLKAKGENIIEGQAVVKNAATNAELTVTFNSFFTRLFRVKGDYNIIKLDRDYQYVMVGSKNRKSLWIMSRQPSMPPAIYQEYLKLAEELDFPVKNLVISRF
jgi:apolipoprotein D and lipocalin family protein